MSVPGEWQAVLGSKKCVVDPDLVEEDTDTYWLLVASQEGRFTLQVQIDQIYNFSSF
jgi:hypothetical protein